MTTPDRILTTKASLTSALASLKNEILGGAGAAFDTLQDLSAALGGDANFATTVMGLIAGKANASHTHAVTDLTATGTRSATTFLRGDNAWVVPTNTVYTLLTQAVVDTGTATAAQTISAAVLKGSIFQRVTGSATVAVSAIGQALNRAADAAAARSAIGAASDADSRLSDARTPVAHKHSVPGDLNVSGTASSSTFLRGDGTWAVPTDTNTTYDVPSQAEAEAGTATVARAFTAQRVSQAANAAVSARVQLVTTFPATPVAGVLYLKAV